MNLRSHTVVELLSAAAQGEELWALDTQSAGEDDVLIGKRGQIVSDILNHFDIHELPEGWTLERISSEAIRNRY